VVSSCVNETNLSAPKNPTEFFLKKVDELNVMLHLDPVAIDWLLKFHVKCKEELAEYGNVQFRLNEDPEKPFYSVGFLGVLNGLVAEPPFYVVADYEDDCVTGFRVLRMD